MLSMVVWVDVNHSSPAVYEPVWTALLSAYQQVFLAEDGGADINIVISSVLLTPRGFRDAAVLALTRFNTITVPFRSSKSVSQSVNLPHYMELEVLLLS
jgi:hypothetical protein